MDLVNNEMDKCLTDQQYIDEVGYMMDDIGSIISSVLGLHMDWQKKQIKQA
jgi:hypothetical protein